MCMKNTDNNQNYKKNAIIFLLLLLILTAVCIGFILLSGSRSGQITAEIYQNGTLIETINLSALEEPRTFTITGENGASNVVEARPGSIGILTASCPDKLCVKQGFIHDSLLPITCLPNRLVIQVRTDGQSDGESIQNPDIVAY